MNKKTQEKGLDVRVFGKHKLNEDELEKAEYALEKISKQPILEIPEELLKSEPSLRVDTRDIYIDKFRQFPNEINYLMDDRATNKKGEYMFPVSTRIYRQKKDKNYKLECIKNI